ncbi:MAG: DNA repair protein RadC [Prevotella sp.]|nr:DNA repair protein RadC [Bacteroides sp.]MCM1366710.1 DNA repair protein RadC [Prevotella sp.]MCM1437276.1 DNA repair protein RadC [Prevotella sp.]
MELEEARMYEPDELLNRDYKRGAGEKTLTVKEFDSDSQPREKALRYGCGVLSIPELWAIILRTGTPGFPVTSLSRQLMALNDNRLHRLERRSRKELTQFRGIGETKAIQIEAVMELIRRYNGEGAAQQTVIKSAADVATLMRSRIGNLSHEQIWVLYLSRRNQVISERCISAGSAVATVFDLKTLLKHALLEEAEGIILVHNHPSGNLMPSGADNKITQMCRKGAEALDLKLLDHVIVSAEGHYSYVDNGGL